MSLSPSDLDRIEKFVRDGWVETAKDDPVFDRGLSSVLTALVAMARRATVTTARDLILPTVTEEDIRGLRSDAREGVRRTPVERIPAPSLRTRCEDALATLRGRLALIENCLCRHECDCEASNIADIAIALDEAVECLAAVLATPPPEHAPRWVPVEERLPEAPPLPKGKHASVLSEPVLVASVSRYTGDVTMHVAYLSVSRGFEPSWAFHDQDAALLDVTHWMPLPEPPR